MSSTLSPFFFILLSAVGIFLFLKKMLSIAKVICSCAPVVQAPLPKIERIKNVLLFAFGQKKVLSNPIVGILHFIIYVSFFIINIELVEIAIDGISSDHRSFSHALNSSLYAGIINVYEYIAVAVIAACLVFLTRRNILKIKRFRLPDLDGFPLRDANIILIAEIALMVLFLAMNASECALRQKGYFLEKHPFLFEGIFFSKRLSALFLPIRESALLPIFYASWWLHYIGILLFLNYLPYSKHLHILLGFANIYQYGKEPSGKMRNMPTIQKEVYNMLNDMPPEEGTTALETGAVDIFQLSRKNVLDAFSCSECGRCVSVCPANLSGKALSPRRIMMAIRDRAEQIMKDKNSKRILLRNYIKNEEIFACTSCQACVEACPILINPLEIIMDLRRGLVLEETTAPAEWNNMFSNIERNYSPWKYPPHERAKELLTPQ